MLLFGNDYYSSIYMGKASCTGKVGDVSTLRGLPTVLRKLQSPFAQHHSSIKGESGFLDTAMRKVYVPTVLRHLQRQSDKCCRICRGIDLGRKLPPRILIRAGQSCGSQKQRSYGRTERFAWLLTFWARGSIRKAGKPSVHCKHARPSLHMCGSWKIPRKLPPRNRERTPNAYIGDS